MDNRSVGFRARAAECLKLAAHVTDRNLRSAFVAMAERLLDMAEEHSRADALTDLDAVKERSVKKSHRRDSLKSRRP